MPSGGNKSEGKKKEPSAKGAMGGDQSKQSGAGPSTAKRRPQQKEGSGSSSNGNGGGEASSLPPSAKEAGSSSGVTEERDESRHAPKIPTREDMKRYEEYVGQEWTGVCKWFNVAKGFGFIVPDFEEAKEHGDDVFVHQVLCPHTYSNPRLLALSIKTAKVLDENEAVEFTVRLGKRGLEAENVKGLAGATIRGHSIRPLGKKKEMKIRCYNCGQLGNHKASKCKNAPLTAGTKVKICYHCQSTDHLLAECPSYKAKKEASRGATQHSPGSHGD